MVIFNEATLLLGLTSCGMKTICTHEKPSSMKVQQLRIPLLLFSICLPAWLISQPLTFTTAGATGQTGPTQAQLNAAFAGTALAGQVTSNNGVQIWTVPSAGLYHIEARGAQGGGAGGGLGAVMEGEFTLNSNDVLHIVVGQEGVVQPGEPNSCGGGGGSFVVKAPATSTADILVIAGGGGGSPAAYSPLRDATAGTAGNNGAGATQSGNGGVGGNGGDATQRSGGGGGFLTNGQSSTQTAANAEGGYAFINGAEGGNAAGNGISGSFGGGGAAWQTGFRGGGGGGGYSGGGGGQTSSNSNTHSGGGGGSFNSGNMQNNQAGINTGDGVVIITPMSPGAPDDAGISAIDAPSGKVCAGNQNVVATITNYGSEILNTVTVNWEVGGQLQTPVTYSNPIDTLNGQNPNTAQINLGTFNFQNLPDTNIKVWTTNPNGIQDTVPFNDTAIANVDINFAVVQVVSSQPPTCPDVEDGQAIVTSLGGTPPFQYFWSSGDTGTNVSSLPSGFVDVIIIDALGCRDTATLNLTAPDSILIDLDKGGVTCKGSSNGFAQLNVSGGTPPYNYNWSNGLKRQNINNIPPGNYSVTVTDDDGCTANKTIDIVQVPILRSQLDSVQPAMCSENAGSATVSGTGGLAPLTYNWPGGLTGRTQTGLAGGTYEVTVVDDAGCENLTTVEVPEVDLGVTFDRPTFYANLDNAFYQWYDCDNDILISGETFQDFTPENPGNYAVIISYENCTDTSGCHYVAYTSAEDHRAGSSEVNVYPNPNSGQFNIAFDGEAAMARLEIFDLNGRLLHSREIQNAGEGYVYQVNDRLASGMYIIKVTQKEETSLHRVIVK